MKKYLLIALSAVLLVITGCSLREERRRDIFGNTVYTFEEASDRIISLLESKYIEHYIKNKEKNKYFYYPIEYTMFDFKKDLSDERIYTEELTPSQQKELDMRIHKKFLSLRIDNISDDIKKGKDNPKIRKKAIETLNKRGTSGYTDEEFEKDKEALKEIMEEAGYEYSKDRNDIFKIIQLELELAELEGRTLKSTGTTSSSTKQEITDLKKQVDANTKRIEEVAKENRQGIALTTAMAQINPLGMNEGKFSAGVGMGYFKGETGLAFGVGYGISEGISLSSKGAFATSDFSTFAIGAGMNFEF